MCGNRSLSLILHQLDDNSKINHNGLISLACQMSNFVYLVAGHSCRSLHNYLLSGGHFAELVPSAASAECDASGFLNSGKYVGVKK